MRDKCPGAAPHKKGTLMLSTSSLKERFIEKQKGSEMRNTTDLSSVNLLGMRNLDASVREIYAPWGLGRMTALFCASVMLEPTGYGDNDADDEDGAADDVVLMMRSL